MGSRGETAARQYSAVGAAGPTRAVSQHPRGVLLLVVSPLPMKVPVPGGSPWYQREGSSSPSSPARPAGWVLRLAGNVDVSGAMLWEIVFFQFRGCLFCVGKRDSSAGLRGHRDCSQEKEFSDFRELWIQAIIQLNVIFLHC